MVKRFKDSEYPDAFARWIVGELSDAGFAAKLSDPFFAWWVRDWLRASISVERNGKIVHKPPEAKAYLVPPHYPSECPDDPA